MRYIISILLIGAAIGVAAFGMLGLQGRMSRKPPVELYSDKFFPGMDKQPKLRPMEPDSFFANGVSSQLPPAGTIARSEPVQTADGEVYCFEDSPVNTGRATGTTNFIETNPLAVNAALIQRGRERFDIYCSPCHGRLGDGNGIEKNRRHACRGELARQAHCRNGRRRDFQHDYLRKKHDGRLRAADADGRPLGGHRVSARAAIE